MDKLSGYAYLDLYFRVHLDLLNIKLYSQIIIPLIRYNPLLGESMIKTREKPWTNTVTYYVIIEKQPLLLLCFAL